MSKQGSEVKTVKCTESVIQTCAYGRFISLGCAYCDYIDITGHRRGCPADACTKYEQKVKKKKSCVNTTDMYY